MKQNRPAFTWFATPCLIVALSVQPLGAQQPLSTTKTETQSLTIFTGGKIFTADSTHPWTEALAVKGKRIIAIGTTADIRRLAKQGSREIQLGGRVVIPGINDAHDHVGVAPIPGDFHTGVSPTPDPTIGQILDSIHSISARTPAGTWIRTEIGMKILGDPAARRTVLDRATPDHPVFLGTWWGHGAVLNSAALHTLNIADNAADPLGGWYERDTGGNITGRLDEYARWGPERRLNSNVSEPALVAALRKFSDSSLTMGVTSVQDMAGIMTPSITIRAFRDARIPVRMRLIRWSIPNAQGRNVEEWNAVPTRVSPRVVVSGRKWVLDGSPIERDALSRSEYSGSAGWHGRLDFPLDTIRAILAESLRPGAAQLHMHIVGDSTAVLVLDQMNALAPDSVWRRLRVRFEHASGLRGPLVERAARLGIVISQPRASAPIQTWRKAGIPLAYGSDGLRNPFYNLMIAVTTQGGNASEALTREQAVTMYTRGSAYAEFAERVKGTLAPGMLADFAVLSQDIFTVPSKALPATRSVLTVIGGAIAYNDHFPIAIVH